MLITLLSELIWVSNQKLLSNLEVTCEYKLYGLPDTKAKVANHHGKSYIQVKPPLVRHL